MSMRESIPVEIRDLLSVVDAYLLTLGAIDQYDATHHQACLEWHSGWRPALATIQGSNPHLFPSELYMRISSINSRSTPAKRCLPMR